MLLCKCDSCINKNPSGRSLARRTFYDHQKRQLARQLEQEDKENVDPSMSLEVDGGFDLGQYTHIYAWQ